MSNSVKDLLALSEASDLSETNLGRMDCKYCGKTKNAGKGKKYCSLDCAISALALRIDSACLRCHKPAAGDLCSTCKYLARIGKTKRSTLKHTLIRLHARMVMEAEGAEKACACGYNKIIEVAHIRAVKDFPMDAPMSEVNAPSNLRYMCPNCHAEHDQKMKKASK